METKLKALKVADLKAVLAKAAVQPPAKATKADLISRILASQPAQDAYRAIYEPDTVVEVEDDPEPEPEPEQSPPPAATPAAPPAEPAPSTSSEPVDAELEKRKQRAARFGIPLVEAPAPKAKGLAPKARAPDGEEEERRKKRVERFGTKRGLPAETVDAEEAERRRKRAERFGGGTEST